MTQPSNTVYLYSADWCGDCRRAKQFLDRHGIAYQVIDIEQYPKEADRLEQETGKRGIPFLRVGDVWTRAYTPGGGPLPETDILSATSGAPESGSSGS